VLRALEEAKKLGVKKAEVRSDSLLIVKQLRGEYKVKEFHLRELRRKVQKATEGMEIIFEHVPREENGKADDLSKRAVGLIP
jgi:ribonuclease HI